jgi:hypothetical protein
MTPRPVSWAALEGPLWDAKGQVNSSLRSACAGNWRSVPRPWLHELRVLPQPYAHSRRNHHEGFHMVDRCPPFSRANAESEAPGRRCASINSNASDRRPDEIRRHEATLRPRRDGNADGNMVIKM